MHLRRTVKIRQKYLRQIKETDTTKTSAADNTAQTDDTPTCAGSDVQLGEYIAKQLGVEPLFVEMEFDDCLKAAKEGTVDLVLLGMLPKNDRKDIGGFYRGIL